MSHRPSHHTAQGFRNNYVASVTRSLGEVLRWQVARLRQGLPKPPTLPTPVVQANLEFLHHNAAPSYMVPAVTWIGHATALVQSDGLNVLTDPIFSRRASPFSFAGPARHHPPGVALGDLPRIDVVAVSHNHYDHLDRASILALAKQRGGSPLFVAPLGLKRWFQGLGIERVCELDWWQHTTHDGVEFHCTPAQHWSGRSLADRNQSLWCAWSVLGRSFQWFFSGDTGYSRDFADTRQHFLERQRPANGGGFDVALIAIGACLPRWFMQPQHVDIAEAIQVHLDLCAKQSIGVHWGTFSLSDESLDQPLHELGPALRSKAVPDDCFFTLPIGATRCFLVRST